ncbi:ATP-binding cassette domain-containing protein [Hymenobacter chitinivorans]|uniref:Polar amino acid transport system ATP-binding protein/sulfate transport system ATP-binding protein n=1 Tax=Hymenobacter chitinivorans DSM 11115 TaxID=1121954 RepID=A0A2M9BR52_9BACT|nr:ATP-binding cassette domain-containing protein [Hymenobacter chitinivorans]PJJ60430.1 polar amino acid transport system ATP-binding protein/sulfate transport system ATP-binding protein [Hymenobacter chitinivorans DSM 11115]
MTPYFHQEPVLTLDNVSMSYQGEVVLRDISAQVLNVVRPNMTQGQVVGFYGRSGIGKSVLCRIIAGLTPPAAGSVRVGEEQHPVQAGDVGLVQQRYPLFNHRTLSDNLLLAAARKHEPEAAKREVAAYLERFRLDQHGKKFPAQLSGGQRQRAAIAQQLLCSDHLILLDEPFSGLDVAMIDEVKKIILEVTTMDELNTVVIVSHDIATTTALSDTLWLMGYERDAAGQLLPGATISQDHQYDLAGMGLAWHPNVEAEPEFNRFVEQLKDEIRAA